MHTLATLPLLELADEAATMQFAATIWPLSRPGDVIALWGILGMGKTCFARGFIRAATHMDEDVPSPTFTLVQTYDSATAPLYHFDCYRLENAEEVLELGIDDAFAEGISLIEWPEKMGYWLPRNRLNIRLEEDKKTGGRFATLNSHDCGWLNRLRGAGLKIDEKK